MKNLNKNVYFTNLTKAIGLNVSTKIIWKLLQSKPKVFGLVLTKYYSSTCSLQNKVPLLDFKSDLGINLSPWWVTGIIDSEGNFSILVQETKNGYKISLAFKVTQKEHSKGIL